MSAAGRVLVVAASRGIGLELVRLAGRASCVALHPGWVRTDMGGEEADIDVATSAAGLRGTLAALEAAQSGAFLNDDGTPLAW